MKRITLYLSHRGWATDERGVCMRGQPYLVDRMLTVTEFGNLLRVESGSVAQFGEFIAGKNGFHASVFMPSESRLLAAVDHIRSIPLFYGSRNDAFFIGDDAEWVRGKVDDRKMDEDALSEFQLASMVTGGRTLFPGVRQLQAGECLEAEANASGVTVTLCRYYRYQHVEPNRYDEDELRKQHETSLLSSFKRLVDHAAGRQIVVPLSGGYDSRLVVLLLKELGYGNLLTFTYGLSGNDEARYSHQVAIGLGLKWQFIEYRRELWDKVWQEAGRWKYQLWSSGWSSLPHLQDWLAVKHMRESGVLADDCIFVAGHGGFLSGSCIPDKAFSSQPLTIRDVSSSILDEYYALMPLKLSGQSRMYWQRRIEDVLGVSRITSPAGYASAVEEWIWQERQSKFICNSIRVYEFFGYDWWMPMCDMDYMRFWQGMPLALRRRRLWFIDYVKAKYAETAIDGHLQEDLGNADTLSIVSRIAKLPLIRQKWLWPYLRTARSWILKALPGYLALEGCFDEATYRHLMRKGYAANGISAAVFVQEFQERTAY